MDRTERSKTGKLWRISRSGRINMLLEGIGIANTLAWDTNRCRFYFADSMVGDIYVFDYDPTNMNISNKNVFFRRDAAPGIPDGSAIDEDGFLWNARWDGSCVVRISPDGELDRIINLQAKRPTSCAFGGDNMSTLFVTTAKVGLHGPSLCEFDGALLSVDAGVRGSDVSRYQV
jgi:sugar lactone lactonase YvrE